MFLRNEMANKLKILLGISINSVSLVSLFCNLCKKYPILTNVLIMTFNGQVCTSFILVLTNFTKLIFVIYFSETMFIYNFFGNIKQNNAN